MASNSDQIWLQFELVRGPMSVQVSCKFEEGPVKNELWRYTVHNIFSIIRLKEKMSALKRCLIQLSPEIVVIREFIPAFVT